jgi:hypothetical protein
VADEQKQRKRDAPEGDKLRMRARHAVAFAMDAPWALLLNEPFEAKIERFAC